MRLLVIASVLAASLCGCALRPRYADFVSSTTQGKEVTFVVTDADTNRPVPGAKVEVSEGKNRVSVTTAADGTFKLPVEKKYLDENPVMLVTLPKGFELYKVALAAPAAVTPPAEPTLSAPPQAPPPPSLEAPDAGMPASNG